MNTAFSQGHTPEHKSRPPCAVLTR